jgi:multidrug resistance efflux pump
VSVGSAQAEVESAQAGIAAAEADLTVLRAGASSQQHAIAGLQLNKGRNSLWCAQAQPDSLGGLEKKGYMKDADRNAVEAALGSAPMALNIAEVAYEETDAGPRPEEITPLQVQVDGARAALSRAGALVEAAHAQLDEVGAEITLAAPKLSLVRPEHRSSWPRRKWTQPRRR